jgi:hypothetical protein
MPAAVQTKSTYRSRREGAEQSMTSTARWVLAAADCRRWYIYLPLDGSSAHGYHLPLAPSYMQLLSPPPPRAPPTAGERVSTHLPVPCCACCCLRHSLQLQQRVALLPGQQPAEHTNQAAVVGTPLHAAFPRHLTHQPQENCKETARQPPEDCKKTARTLQKNLQPTCQWRAVRASASRAASSCSSVSRCCRASSRSCASTPRVRRAAASTRCTAWQRFTLFGETAGVQGEQRHVHA